MLGSRPSVALKHLVSASSAASGASANPGGASFEKVAKARAALTRIDAQPFFGCRF